MNQQSAHNIELLCLKLENHLIPIYFDSYPALLENQIQDAVQEKRQGNYDLAISIYLDIFSYEEKVSSAIATYLYKVLIADATRLDLAYRLIVALEQEVVEKNGLTTIFGIPWGQTVHRTQLQNVLLTFSENRDMQPLYDYAKQLSGNDNYEMIATKQEVLFALYRMINKEPS